MSPCPWIHFDDPSVPSFLHHFASPHDSKLSENLLKALIKMKYPQPIQPHHIQGLDYDHLFPLIQWLVKQVLETRRLTGDLVRQFSEAQFDKHYSSSRGRLRATAPGRAGDTSHEPGMDDSETSTRLTIPSLRLDSPAPSLDASEYLRRVSQASIAPVRKFRSKQMYGSIFRPYDADRNTIARRCEATLLEFDEQLQPSLQVDEEREDQRSTSSSSAAGGGRLAAKREADEQRRRAQQERLREAEQAETARLQQLRAEMGEEETQHTLSGQAVGSIVQLGAEDILKAQSEFLSAGGLDPSSPTAAAAEFEETKTEEEIQLELEEQTHQRRIAAQKRRIQELETVIKAEKPEYLEVEEAFLAQKAALEKREAYLGKVRRETAKLEAQEQSGGDGNQETLRALKDLVSLNEQLSAQEKQFKAVCRRHKKELLAELASLQSVDREREEEMKKLDALLSKDSAKLDKLRQVLARKNQEISKLSREIDEIPTRFVSRSPPSFFPCFLSSFFPFHSFFDPPLHSSWLASLSSPFLSCPGWTTERRCCSTSDASWNCTSWCL